MRHCGDRLPDKEGDKKKSYNGNAELGTFKKVELFRMNSTKRKKKKWQKSNNFVFFFSRRFDSP